MKEKLIVVGVALAGLLVVLFVWTSVAAAAAAEKRAAEFNAEWKFDDIPGPDDLGLGILGGQPLPACSSPPALP